MNSQENNIILAALESFLVYKFRPTFLALTFDEESEIIQVVISANSFNYLSLSERVINIFNEIDKQFPSLMESHLIVLQPYNSIEIEKVLNDLFEDNLDA